MLDYFNFFAGIALMLFGIRSLREGADRFFGARFRQLIQSATNSRFRATVAGFVISILTPSSTAVSLLAVESMNAGFATLPQMLALMLGANIGFTVTVQLLAFKFYVYNGIFIVPGALLYLFSRRQNIRGAGQAILGLGFVLLAIQILSATVAPIKDNAEVLQIIRVLQNHAVWLALLGLVLQVVLQSSTTTIGIAIVLVVQKVLTVEAAAAVVMGANIGIGVTSLIAGYAHVDTRRLAMGNLGFKLIGVLAIAPFLPWVLRLLEPLSATGDTHDSQLIANLHTFFNLVLALVFLPLIPLVSRVLEKLLPKPMDAKSLDEVQYLDSSSLASPALALGQATREVLNMADHVRTMLRDSYRCFTDGDETLCLQVQERDDVVDRLNNAIKTFLTKISERALNVEEARRQIALLAFAGELECIGDIIDKSLMESAKKKLALRVQFSKAGWADLDPFYKTVMDNFDMAVSAFVSQDQVLAKQLLDRKRQLNELEPELRTRHFHRLQAGLTESFETSAIHLDVLTNLRHINSLVAAVAYPILESKPV